MATEQPRPDVSGLIDALQPDETPFLSVINDPNFVHRPVPPYKAPPRWKQAIGQVRWWRNDVREWVAYKFAPWLRDR